MLYTLLQPWDSVEFEVEVEGKRYTFRSVIAEKKDDTCFKIYSPTSVYPGVEVPLEAKAVFTFFILNGGILRFTGEILMAEGIYLQILLTSDGDVVERREKYRFDIDIPIKVNESQIGFIKNISLKGLQLASNNEFEMDDKITLEMDMFAQAIKLRGTVVRKELGVNSNFKYEYGIRYREISREQSLLVTDFIFELQRRKLLN